MGLIPTLSYPILLLHILFYSSISFIIALYYNHFETIWDYFGTILGMGGSDQPYTLGQRQPGGQGQDGRVALAHEAVGVGSQLQELSRPHAIIGLQELFCRDIGFFFFVGCWI